MDANLIAPCGMNCSLCGNFLALKNDVKSKDIRMPYCTGCRPRGKQCAYIIKQCDLLVNKKITYCYECQDFPCHNLRGIDKRYRERYHMSMIENLLEIKEKGIEKFLERQEEKWRCPKCGEMISCHNGLCFVCDLSTLESKEQKYRWEE